ncbi:hypothetical protein PsorP6_003725 [Peronosclerospora sorghi]|uniref:Uncharacterized protein n=1 Tax=Peronosclerospora sorghi TaxID=230839 RepID=A0ACC0VMR5_9STRA|nr:hypothetical protein PsorP6_003725 [Peronosclerospora sorghi]
MGGLVRRSLLVMLWYSFPANTTATYDPSSRFSGFSSDRYIQLSRAEPDDVVPLVIGLFPKDFGALEREFYDVSNPTHPQYGQYLAQDRIDDLSYPGDGVLNGIHNWVANFSHGDSMGTYLATSNLYKVLMKVRDIENLLDTELHHFEAIKTENILSSTKRRILRAVRAVSLPEHLKDAVSFVNVNTHPLGLRALEAFSLEDASLEDDTGDTLAVIRRTYGIPGNLVVRNASNTQCVPSFYNESFDPADLYTFFGEYLPGETPPPIIHKGNRINKPKRASTEASLDVQYITGVSRNATTYVWTMNGSNPYSSEDEPFVEFAQDVLELENPPLVISISYSDDEEHIFDVAWGYARTLDALLIKMGLRGITVLIASGDDGVTGLRTEFDNVPIEEMCKRSGPQWPSSSPYITSVGATMLLTKAQYVEKPFFRTKDEVICSYENGGIITTGGGFSNIYPIPEYQRKAVERYLTTRNIPTTPGFFNASGRAYPDVSALGAKFSVYMNGHLSSVSGTSASTPVFGAMVTLWNDARLNVGKSPLGFINPLLYYLAEKHTNAFHDVIVGNNGAKRGEQAPCEDSFSAAAGWDAVSGIGTPNFTVISELIINLEDHFTVSKLDGSNSSDESNSSDTSTTPLVKLGLLVAAVLVNVAICIVLVLALVKRWRNQYVPLDDVACGSTAAQDSIAQTTFTARTEKLALDKENIESVVELSEINLN